MINDRSLFAYIGAAVTAGALMALPLPAQADSHAGTATNGAHLRLAFPSAPDGGGGGGGEEEVKKPRKEVPKHRPIRHIAQRPRKHYHHFVHKPYPREQVKVSVESPHGGGGGGGHRHHGGHHGHHHNGHFADDIYVTRQARRYHNYHEALEALTRDANHWLRQRPVKVHHHHGHRGHDAVRDEREAPSAQRDSGRKDQ
ncbi:hypothetical protein DQ384_10845 [Sphaerisporangium album]|uniref:Uncharacterized protein n=1 Tax=Sphaerisporangium album TaxID=509200 RepID=A0A367FMU9_9ACTN|nr:hypothetical protein [Sphaerisporangium album]RCG31229.1 hypothetical protein DQ384_10845 [Sphaerisporangium album]